MRLLIILFLLSLLIAKLTNAEGKQIIFRGMYNPENQITKNNTPSKTSINKNLINTQNPEYHFLMALAFEEKDEFELAIQHYQDFLKEKKLSVNREKARFKIRILKDAIAKNSLKSLRLYLDALNSRQQNNYGAAQIYCEKIIKEYPNSHLADDAQHLKAYIEFIDKKSYESALALYQKFIDERPNSEYSDNTLYGKALIYEKLKRFPQAKQLLQQLKTKHTAFSLNFADFAVPKDNFLSRLWFCAIEP